MGACCGKPGMIIDDDKKDIEMLKNSKLPIIWVLGGPGSGKSTQCSRLAKQYGFLHVAPTNLLSEEVASGSPKGQELNDIMSQGILVPRDMVRGVIRKAMVKNVDTAKGFLIDGYPREVEQGIDFENKIGPCSLILYYDCSDETMTNRLLERGIRSRRADDNEEIIKQRLRIFHKHSAPVMNYFSTKVARIDGNTDPDRAFGISVENVDKILVVDEVPLAVPQE